MKKPFVCSKCGAEAKHSKQVGPDAEKTLKTQQTLGTWRCPIHGKVAVKRG